MTLHVEQICFTLSYVIPRIVPYQCLIDKQYKTCTQNPVCNKTIVTVVHLFNFVAQESRRTNFSCMYRTKTANFNV